MAADNRAEQDENRQRLQPCFAKHPARAIVMSLMLRRQPKARMRVFNALCPAMTNAGLRIGPR